jgi:hypothetical protein
LVINEGASFKGSSNMSKVSTYTSENDEWKGWK